MKFSIVIPTYNRAKLIPKAIESVLNQTYTNWELIIVDDGSTDNTKEVVLNYKDERIKYIYQQNLERSAARNNGIRNSTGDVICFMDSDNYYLPHRLENIFNFLQANGKKIAMYYTDIIYEYPDKTKNLHKKGKEKTFPVDKVELITEMIATPQVCISKEILKENNFDESLVASEDTDLWFRISEKYPIIYIPEDQPTVIEIEHEGRSVNFSSDINIKYIKTLKKIFKKPHPASKLPLTIRNKKLSEAYLRGCYYYMSHKLRKQAIKNLFFSFLLNPISKQNFFKLNLLLNILKGNFNFLEKL